MNMLLSNLLLTWCMARISKCIVAIITVILAISVFTLVGNAFAQTIPKLSVPEFALEILVVSGGLEIGVQNQYVISNGYDHPWIFYDFRYKWHESENWYYFKLDPSKEGQYIAETGTTGVTRIVVHLNRFYEILGSSNSYQLEMQIRAINGYSNYTSSVPQYGIDPNDYPVVVVNASDWSQTQTIEIPASSIMPTPSPSVPEFSWLMTLSLFILILSFVVLIRKR